MSRRELDGWEEVMFPVTVPPGLYGTERFPGARDTWNGNGPVCRNIDSVAPSSGGLSQPGRCVQSAWVPVEPARIKVGTRSWD